MKNINKNINITLIFILIGVILLPDYAYSSNKVYLRVPIQPVTYNRIKNVIKPEGSIKPGLKTQAFINLEKEWRDISSKFSTQNAHNRVYTGDTFLRYYIAQALRPIIEDDVLKAREGDKKLTYIVSCGQYADTSWLVNALAELVPKNERPFWTISIIVTNVRSEALKLAASAIEDSTNGLFVNGYYLNIDIQDKEQVKALDKLLVKYNLYGVTNGIMHNMGGSVIEDAIGYYHLLRHLSMEGSWLEIDRYYRPPNKENLPDGYSNLFDLHPGSKYGRLNTVYLYNITHAGFSRIENGDNPYAIFRVDSINTTILGRKAFPSSLLRELFSETGLKIYFHDKDGNKVSIDLSIPGINDGIVIKFVDRRDLNKQPFTKTESDKKIIYTIANDITLNELRYVLKDLDSILSKYKNRLKLSNAFSLRLRHLAIYLAKNIDLKKPEESVSNLKERIEDLYLLGLTFDRENILRPDKKINPVTFEEIKKRRHPYKEAILDYMKDNDMFLSLASENTDIFIKKILNIMRKEAILTVRTHFNGAIFVKGTEKLFSELKKRYGLTERLINYLKALFKVPVRDYLLKDNLTIEDCKNRLKNATTEIQEIENIKEIVRIVDKYPGWKNKIDYIVKYSISKEELSCLARSMLLARMFKEIGIKEDRICYAGFPGHAFLIIKLKSGSYLEIGTIRRGSKNTTLLSDTTAKKLDKAFKKANLVGSVRVEFEEPLWSLNPETRVIVISNAAEGLLTSDSCRSLVSDIYLYIERNPDLTEKEKIKILYMGLILLKEVERLVKNNPSTHYAQGYILKELAMIEKDKNPEKAIKYLNEACKKYEKAIEINKYSEAFFSNDDMLLYELAMIEKDKDPEKAIKHLNEAIEKVKRIIEIDPQDRVARNNLKEFNREKISLEKFLKKDVPGNFFNIRSFLNCL